MIVIKDPNLDIRYPWDYGYEYGNSSKIFLGKQMTSITTYYDISKHNIFDILSYLGGILKIISYIKVITIINNQYLYQTFLRKLVTNNDFEYFNKNT